MVKGLDLFRERFRDFEGSFTLIGGAACDEWFTAQGLPFRVTNDLDIVLIIEVIDRAFVGALRAFIAEGDYEVRQRTEGSPVLYRFAKPKNEQFPFMFELFSRKPEGLQLGDGQEIVPVPVGTDQHSLSALLLDEDYYALIETFKDVRDGLPFATPTALIPLKAHAWLNLTKRKADGAEIDTKNITKHRNDVFRLAGTLPGDPGPQLANVITGDLIRFLAAFPEDSPAWPAILHLQTYKKRPIYWLVQSPRKGFSVLIYLHPYARDTMNLVLNRYLRDYQVKLRNRLAHVTELQVTADTAKAKTETRKEAEKLTRILAECDEWERQTMLPLAQARIELDLDDGVKVNYLKLGEALAPIAGLAKEEEWI